jgi:serine phosphatase RsbU (regulator of sigma subunit)
MSGQGFHVHGPHDHEVEHVAQHGGDSFTSKLAVLTAVLSTVGAIFGYMGGHSQNSALLFKNESSIQKTAASNQWNYYQAKSNKQNLAELSVVLTQGEAQQKFRQEVERYQAEKKEIKIEAEKLEAAATKANEKSELEMHVHERWAMATTLLQIAIALSAITLLTRKRWMLGGVYGATAAGLIIGAMGYFHL